MSTEQLFDLDDTAAVRRAHEADFTPQGLVVDLSIALDKLLVEAPLMILDPCAGPGAWGQVAAELWPDAGRLGVDLRESETGGGHYHRFASGIRAEAAIAGLAPLGGRFREAIGVADAVITNPAFKMAFERGDGRGKARKARPCLLDIIRANLLNVRVVALLGRSQWGERGDGVGIVADHPPLAQLRATAPVACRGGSATDAADYSLWVWGDPTILRVTPASVGWLTLNVPATSTCGASYRWEGGRPGDVDLTPPLVERIKEARRRRVLFEAQFAPSSRGIGGRPANVSQDRAGKTVRRAVPASDGGAT